MTRAEALTKIRALTREIKALRRSVQPRRESAQRAARLSRDREARSRAVLRTAEIRSDVLDRSKGLCEVPGCCYPGQELDHWLGGVGRRKARESVETTWLLCWHHHRERAANWPTAARWNELFSAHCARHGYPFTRHKEKTP